MQNDNSDKSFLEIVNQVLDKHRNMAAKNNES